MALHYNAFISYKHAPLDTKVAAEVQRQLERFKVPKAIQKATGVKRINRIFRDKEELTLTSDLNETIENALNNSDFLIVICSLSTKESIWVQREIEFFLKTHTRKQILTVVAEGEPVDVVPQILQYQEMELMTEDGNIETVRVPLEPLSCDYRGNFKKARRDELPRLAAALLGCSYDDLRRRQRQYRVRRITAAVTALSLVLTGLAAYYAWSATQIQKNYEQSLRNQSDYLASESQKLLSSGDRLTAMLLALEALPSWDSERPVTPKAVNALSEASYAYVPYGNSSLTLDKAYTCQGQANAFRVNEDQTILAVIHSNHYNLSVFDTKTGMELFSVAYDEQIKGMDFSPAGDLMVIADYQLFCYDPLTGESKWAYTFDSLPTEMDISPEGVIAVTTVYTVTVLDRAGSLLTTLDAPLDAEGEPFQLSDVAVNADGSYVSATLSITQGDYAGCPVVWDVQTGESHLNETYLYWVQKLLFLDNNTILAAALTTDENSMTYTDSSGNVSHMLYPGCLELLCLDTQGNTLWQQQVHFPQQYYGTYIEQLEFLTVEEQQVPAVACAVGNICQVMQLETGEILEKIDFPDPTVGLKTGDNGLVCVLSGGTRALYLYTSRFPVVHEDFVGDLSMSEYGKSIFVCQSNTSRILRYSWDIYDENWMPFAGDPGTDSSIQYRLATDDGMLLQTYDGTLRYYDAVSQSLRWSWTVPEGTDYYDYSLMAVEDGGASALMVYDSVDAQYLLRFDLQTGKTTQIDLSAPLRREVVRYCNGAVYYQSDWTVTDDATGEARFESGMVRMDLETGEVTHYPFTMNFRPTGFTLDETGETFLLYAAYDSEIGIYQNGEFHEITGVYDPDASVMSQDASRFALVGSNCIYVTDPEINVFYTIPTNGMHPQSMRFYEDQLLVAYENGVLYRYDAATGNYLGNLEITAGSFSSTPYFVWDFSIEGVLALQLNNELNLIDLESWQLYTQVGFCAVYLPQRNAVLVKGTTEDSLSIFGMYNLYSVPDLIANAHLLLNGLDLTPAQKTEYGISD